MSTNEQVDVVVVGAGFSGLAAAKAVRDAGRSVKVLEARDRVGGRTFNFELDSREITEAGGQFIGATQPRLAALAEEFGIGTFPAYTTGRLSVFHGGHETDIDFTTSSPENDLPELIKALQEVADATGPKTPWSAARAATWDSQTMADWIDTHARTELGRDAMATLIRTMLGVEPREVSCLYAAHYIASAGDESTPGSFLHLIATEGGAQAERFEGGSHAIVQRIADSLGGALELSAPVRRIEHDDDGVRVSTDTRTVTGARAIVAIPPPLAREIDFAPALPPQHEELLSSLRLGRLSKFQAVYETPFWRAEGHSGNALFLGETDLSAVFDNTPPSGSPGILMAFSGGNRSRELASLSREDRRDRVVNSFSLFAGDRAKSPIEFLEVQWLLEEWTGGGPGPYAGPGVLTSLGHLIGDATPPIHWAGTETAVYWKGYMEGAIRSGERAAAEALEGIAS